MADLGHTNVYGGLNVTHHGQFQRDLTVNGTFNNNSDRRLKSDIEPITDILFKVRQIDVYRYHRPDLDEDQRKYHIGVIAQEVIEVFPELVTLGDDGYYAVNYMALSAIAIGAVSELSALVDQQYESIDDLSQRLTKVEQLI